MILGVTKVKTSELIHLLYTLSSKYGDCEVAVGEDLNDFIAPANDVRIIFPKTETPFILISNLEHEHARPKP